MKSVAFLSTFEYLTHVSAKTVELRVSEWETLYTLTLLYDRYSALFEHPTSITNLGVILSRGPSCLDMVEGFVQVSHLSQVHSMIVTWIDQYCLLHRIATSSPEIRVIDQSNTWNCILQYSWTNHNLELRLHWNDVGLVVLPPGRHSLAQSSFHIWSTPGLKVSQSSLFLNTPRKVWATSFEQECSIQLWDLIQNTDQSSVTIPFRLPCTPFNDFRLEGTVPQGCLMLTVKSRINQSYQLGLSQK